MLTDEARPLWHHVVDQNRMFMNITHEKLIPIFFGKNISQIETGSAVSGLVNMIPNSLNVIIYERVYILFALLMINAPLYDMKEMRDHTTSSKSLPHIIEIKTPGIRQALGKDFKFLGLRMEAPNATINKLPVFILITGATYTRLGENTMTTIQPAIRAPNETVQSFMPVLNTPTV